LNGFVQQKLQDREKIAMHLEPEKMRADFVKK